MDSLECMEEDFEVNAVFDGKPMELVKNRGDVTDGRGSGDDTGSSILDQLELMEEFVGETNKEGIAVIQAGSDKGVDQDCGAVGGE